MLYFISDLHLGHYNIIKYQNRPFSSVEEQSEVIINNINEKVEPKDTLIIGGDAFMYRRKGAKNKEWFNRINCRRVILVTGNHDKQKYIKQCSYAQVVTDMYFKVQDKEIKGGLQPIHIYHYPLLSWRSKFPHAQYGWHLYGHTHANTDEHHPDDGKYPVKNICVENLNYSPISYLDLRDNYFSKWVKYK